MQIKTPTKKTKLTEIAIASIKSRRVNEKIFEARQADLDPAAILQRAINRVNDGTHDIPPPSTCQRITPSTAPSSAQSSIAGTLYSKINPQRF